jgi:hypothetical protein
VTVREALGAGMDLFVTKPFRYESLVDVLLDSRLLGERGEVIGRDGKTGRRSFITAMKDGPRQARKQPASGAGASPLIDADAGNAFADAMAAAAAAVAAAPVTVPVCSEGESKQQAPPVTDEEDEALGGELKKKPTGRLPPIK